MKRLIALSLLTPLLLAACGSAPAGNPDPTGMNLSIGAAADDSASSVTVTRSITPATAGTPATPTSPAVPGTPAVTKYAVGPAGPATFVFTSRPGSNAAYITSYKVVRASINGVDQGSGSVVVFKNNTYVASGYSCSPALGPDQSCAFQDPTAKPANGVPSALISIGFSSGLSGLAKSINSNVVEDLDIEFYGVSSTNAPVTIRLNHVIATAIFNDA
ncbi:hypothetical protein Q0M94_14445 [Deinococcus radiomollis]|uniref:hypothetical protein n=1 Tax=Deinococcus radiomollis TaxID=468916 RepID=UPI00389214F3